MAGCRVRRANISDLDAIASVATASDLGPFDSGSDPDYVAHLIRHGVVALAEDDNPTPLGFAASLPIGPATMLTDLFVRPDAQGRGAGAALLADVLGGATRPMTFSSKDPRALALYTRFGMSGRWALLYLRGDPRRLPAADSQVEQVEPTVAAAWERSWTGVDRAAQYEYWAARPRGAAYLRRAGGAVVAAWCAGGGGLGYGLPHLSVAPGQDPRDAVLTALAQLEPGCLVCLPSPHPAVATLLRQGFVIDDFDLFMAGPAGLPAAPSGVYAPGLC